MSVFYPRCGALMHATMDGRGAPNKIITVPNIYPRSCTISRNGYHEADTWRAEFDLRALPFDPEGIASIAIRIYMWNGGTFQDRYPSFWAIEDFEMIRGLADEDSLRVDKSRHSLEMSGRDYTAVLDPEWDCRQSLRSGVPLVDEVQRIADLAAPPNTTARFLVVWDVKDDDGNPVDPKQFLSNGSARSTKTKGMWVKQGKTTWDVIYDLVIQNGFICFVKDSRIIITTPRTQMSGDLTTTPVVAYGRDLIELEVKRKLARERVPRVRIVFWDAKKQRQFETIYPPSGGEELSPNATNDSKLTIGLGLKKNEDLVIPAPPYCHDRDSALRFAKMRWELMARSESTYTAKTRHLSVPTGENSNLMHEDETRDQKQSGDFDLLRLDAGRGISIKFDPFNRENMRSMDLGQREAFMIGLGFPEKIASFVALNIDRIDQFRQPYYSRKIDYDYDHQNGLEIDIEAVNFAYERREIKFANEPVEIDFEQAATLHGPPIFTSEGPPFFAAALAHNQPFAVPPPWTTSLGAKDEASFRSWVALNRVPFAPNDVIVDYDMRGFWYSVIKGGGVWEGGHFPDTWKTPYDTTFSKESKYATQDCPFTWSELADKSGHENEVLVDTRDGQIIFGPPGVGT